MALDLWVRQDVGVAGCHRVPTTDTWSDGEVWRTPPRRKAVSNSPAAPTPTKQEEVMDKEYVLNQLLQGRWIVRRVKGDGSARHSIILEWRR